MRIVAVICPDSAPFWILNIFLVCSLFRETVPGVSHPGATGVIYCTDRAMANGFSYGNEEWVRSVQIHNHITVVQYGSIHSIDLILASSFPAQHRLDLNSKILISPLININSPSHPIHSPRITAGEPWAGRSGSRRDPRCATKNPNRGYRYPFERVRTHNWIERTS